MKTHSEDTIVDHNNLHNSTTHNLHNSATHMEAHKSRDVSDVHISEVKDLGDTSIQSSVSTAPYYRTDNEDLPTSVSALNKGNLPDTHHSEAPYIMNVKIEDDLNIKQEGDI